MNAVEVEGISIRFGDFTAVRDVTFAVGEGEVFGLLGPNGSGKTTLIKALCGLVRIAEGRGAILSMDVRKDAPRIRQNIGYMSQRFGLYEDLTVRENIGFYAGVYGIRDAKYRSRFDEVIALTSLAPYLDRRAGLLSGGWKQRLALCCAILHEPRVVFLDEPTAGIDPVARRTLWDLVFQLSARGVTFFVTTHYMDEAERCSRVGYLYLSRLIALGSVADLKLMPDVNPQGTARLEISTPRVSEALAAMRGFSFVREATIFGQSIHALVEAESEPRLIAALEAAGFPGARAMPIEPSLEDVFVTLTNQATERAR